MTVKQLRELIKDVPDDVKIITGAEDHSYREVHMRKATALCSGKADWTEDYGEDATPEKEYGKRLNVLIVA